MKLLLASVALVALCYFGGVRCEEDAMAEWTDQGDAAADSMLMLPALVRSERDVKRKDTNKPANKKKAKGDNCKYVKGAWGECDAKTNLRTRTLTLKKGDQNTCEATKTIQKKCKKGKNCSYDKGAWGACNAQNQMSRTDRIKAGSDASCEATRQVIRPCKTKPANNKQNKGTGNNGSGRRNRQ